MSVVLRTELEAALGELRASTADPRAGILGPRSVSWQIGGDLAVFIGGGRAALLQLAHPMVAYAIDHHSTTRRDVLGRFQRTFRNVFAMVFGELDDAFVAARRVHQVHTRITGTIPEAIGSWAAGTPYAANDAAALRWVHATLVDTTLLVRERIDGPLPEPTKDAFIVEMNRFARLFGIPERLLGDSYADHAAYMARMLPTLAVAPCAREMAQFLVGKGTGMQTPLGRVVELVTASMLPRELVRAFGLVDSPLATLAIRAAAVAFAPAYRALPRDVVAIPATSDARRRLAGLPPSRFASWTERQLFGLGRRVTG